MGEFITPDVLPKDTFCRVLLIPNDPKWIGAVSGALLPMMHASEWIAFEGITPEEAAERSRVMLYEFWNSDGCGNVNNCCDEKPTLHRFDPTTGRPQISTNGGDTWQPDPADLQNAIPLLPPPIAAGVSATKCDAATNASQHVNEIVTATGENLATATDVFSLAVAVAEAALGLFLVIVSAGTLSPLVVGLATAIWAAATGVFNIGVDLYNAYWTTDKLDVIFCAIACNIGDDGQFTEAQYQAFRTKVKSTLPASPALDIVLTTINAAGARGLSQMASYGNAAEADCESCNCDECPSRPYVAPGGGTEISWEDCTLTAESVLDGSYYSVYIWFNNPVAPYNPNACGTVTSYNVVSGSGVAIGYNDCVTAANHLPPQLLPTGSISQLWFSAAAPFTVEVYVGAP